MYFVCTCQLRFIGSNNKLWVNKDPQNLYLGSLHYGSTPSQSCQVVSHQTVNILRLQTQKQMWIRPVQTF